MCLRSAPSLGRGEAAARSYSLLPMASVWWWGVGWLPPTGVCARCRGYRPPLEAGTKRPVASPPLHNSPPGAGSNRTCGPRRPCRGGIRGGGGVRG